MPRQGVPPLPGLVGFAVLTALCVAVVVLLYRSDACGGHLVRHREPAGRRPGGRSPGGRRAAAPAGDRGWLLTARVAAFTYSPLMLVPALIAGGAVLGGRLGRHAGRALLVRRRHRRQLRGAASAPSSCMRGRAGPAGCWSWSPWACSAIDLPLCWWLLGTDGLIRDGAPLVAAAVLACYALCPRHAAPATPARHDREVGGLIRSRCSARPVDARDRPAGRPGAAAPG